MREQAPFTAGTFKRRRRLSVTTSGMEVAKHNSAKGHRILKEHHRHYRNGGDGQ